jgi:hypothetical protein
MPLHITCIADFQASVCYRRKSAENLSIVISRRFFLTVKRTLATTTAVFKTFFRVLLIVFLYTRESTTSATTVYTSSTSSISSLF